MEKYFSSVKYFVSGKLNEQVRQLLEDGGAQKVNFFNDTVTHCIVGENARDTDVSDAKELYEVPAVTPSWVLLSAHCNKPLPTKGFLYDTKQIFYGTRMTASGVSQADYKALWAMVTFYGGMFQSKLTKDCTHLIAGRASGAKYEQAIQVPTISVVTPDWIVECVNNGSTPVESFHPRLLIIPKPREPTPPPPGNLSTAQILGFTDDMGGGLSMADDAAASTQALLEKLKQRMPWNQTPSSSPAAPGVQQKPIPTSAVPGLPMPAVSLPQTIPQQNLPQPNHQLSMQQQQQQQQVLQQQPMQRLVNPGMVRPGQPMQTPPGTPGPQMKQFRLIHRDPNAMQGPRMELIQGVQMQIQNLQPPQQQQQQQQQLMQQQQPSSDSPQQQMQVPQQTILQGPGIQQGAPRPGTWVQGPQGPQQVQGPPKQVIQLDPQTHAQLSQMDPQQKMMFLHRIHQRQIMMQRQQQMMQQQQQQQQNQGPQRVLQQGQVQRQQGQQMQQVTMNGQQVAISSQQTGLGQQQVPMVTQQVSLQGQQVMVGQQVGQVTMSQQQVALQGQPQQQQQVQVGQVPMPMRQQQIIIRNISPQQQSAWLQQQQFIRQQQMQGGGLRPAGAPGTMGPRLVQQQTATATWIPGQEGAPTQQQIHQMQLQRQQQLRMQTMKQVVIQRAPAPMQQFTQVQQGTQVQQVAAPQPQPVAQLHSTEEVDATAGVGGGIGGIVVNNRTKTALANMLSSRLQTTTTAPHLSPQQQQVMGVAADGTAAGQLRLMSAQQRAPQPPPQLPEAQPSQPLYSPQSAAGQPRRTLGNITNAASVGPPQGPKSPARAPLTSPSPAPAPVANKSQFYTHHPNVRIPLDKYFIGCVFYIVEYDKCDSPDVNLSAWEEIIREHGGEVDSTYTHRVTHVLCESQKYGFIQQALRDGKRCVSAFWLNDCVVKGSLMVPSHALHFPVPFGREKPLSKFHLSLTGFEDRQERDRVALMIKIAGGNYRNYFSTYTNILVCRKPEGAKYRKAKEWNKPTVNVQWLNEVLLGHYSCIQQPELHKYQQFNATNVFRIDYALIPHLMAAWKMPINMTPEVYNAVKSSPPAVPKAKRPRLEYTAEQMRELESKELDTVQVLNIDLLTMENRPWVVITGDTNLQAAKKAKQLGCFIVKSLSKVTHLVVCGKPIRTTKLLTALITCKYVVSEAWLTDSAAQTKLLPEEPYQIQQLLLGDVKCDVPYVLSCSDRSSLLKDKIFYMTPGVFPSRSALVEMVELSGGRVDKQRRSIKAIREMNTMVPTYFVISCFDDMPLIADMFRAKVEFYSTELIMRTVASQKFEPSLSLYKY